MNFDFAASSRTRTRTPLEERYSKSWVLSSTSTFLKEFRLCLKFLGNCFGMVLRCVRTTVRASFLGALLLAVLSTKVTVVMCQLLRCDGSKLRAIAIVLFIANAPHTFLRGAHPSLRSDALTWLARHLFIVAIRPHKIRLQIKYTWTSRQHGLFHATRSQLRTRTEEMTLVSSLGHRTNRNWGSND